MKASNSETQSAPLENRVHALELRKLGLSYRDIGERVGVAPCEAKKMVSEEILHLEELAEGEPKMARRLQLERINKLRTALMAKAMEGDAQAVNSLLKCDEHELKLLNATGEKDQPSKYIFAWHDETDAEGTVDSPTK